MRFYQIYKVKGNGTLEPMGGYEASTGQAAINKMAKRGNLKGKEWAMKSITIPNGSHFKHYSPIV